MLTQRSFRNFYKSDFHPYLEKYNYKNVRNITRGADGTDYQNFVNFLRRELRVNPALKYSLNKLISEKLFFNQMNIHYVFNLTSFFGTKEEVKVDEISNLFKEQDFNLNNNLFNYKCTKDYDICCTTYDTKTKDGIKILTNIRMIIFTEKIEKDMVPINMFATIDIDLESKFISFKFDTRNFEYHSNRYEVIENMTKMFYDRRSPLHQLGVTLESHNLAKTRVMIQNLFIELSSQAEKLLKEHIHDDTDNIIDDFFKKLNIPKNEEYTKQIIAVIYQDISRNFNETDFGDGWVFRFLFREGDNTRASSISDNFKPIYNTQIYWNLKELMFNKKGTDFIEAGFLWFVDNSDAVSVKIEQKNDFLIVSYYHRNNNYINRKEKEKLVLRNIKKGLR